MFFGIEFLVDKSIELIQIRLERKFMYLLFKKYHFRIHFKSN